MSEDRITYTPDKSPGVTRVYLGRRLAGRIFEVFTGFYYKADKSRATGDTFATLALCKQSLEC